MKTLAGIYDPLGIVSLMLAEGKQKQSMRGKVGTSKLVKSLRENVKWVRSLQRVKVPRSIAPHLEDLIQVSHISLWMLAIKQSQLRQLQ